MNPAQLDPFRDQIVSDARARNLTVPGLNERPLETVRARFAELIAEPAPRPLRAARQALLITSEQPGYGKSHLISRLFRELHGQASLVYVRPFQNAHTPFYSLMLAVVRELHLPDRESTGSWDRDAPSQLDHLAHAVLAHLLADLVEGHVPGFEIDTERETADAMRADPLAAFQRGKNNWAAWLEDHWFNLEKAFEPAMARRGLEISHPDLWLRVLRCYAFSPFDPVTRRICTQWMCGEPLETDDGVRIGLRPAELPSLEMSPDEMDHLSRGRLHDLCELSCYFRPVVFCFDQTEVYCTAPALARVFGMVIATLVNDLRGHLVMLTANQVPWSERLVPHIEVADLDRIEKPYVNLEGINRAQAGELVRLRLEDAAFAEGDIKLFLARPWFPELFPAETAQIGARTFLQKCREAWSGPSERPSLELLFAERRDEILASPKRHVFEPDTLQWLMETATRGLAGIEISSLDERYATVRWSTPERDCFFGFLTGSVWNQWLAAAQTSGHRQGSGEKPCKSIYFRVPGQPPIPKETWRVAGPDIRAAQQCTLQVIPLSLEELGDLYAPRDLYADAAQGDIPFSTDEVLAFLQQRLAPYWQRFAGPIETAAPSSATPTAPAEDDGGIPQPSPLAKEVCRIVEQSRFLSLDELLAQLDRPGVTRDAALEAVGFCGNIRLHTHPNMTVLQWQPRR
jgi:hypothetical protein